MKTPGNNNNMYVEAKRRALAPYASAMEGPVDAAVCVAYADELPAAARTALAAACAGIGLDEPVFLDVRAAAGAGVASGTSAHEVAGEGADHAVARQVHKNLFAAVEALDSLMLVLADGAAARLVQDAYREPVALNAHGFVFGRAYAAFSSFARDLADPRMKQRDWAVLKAMRKSDSWLK